MDGGLITGLVPKKWTVGAIECYKRNCKCEGCFIQKTYWETLYLRCYMKSCVRQLIEMYGVPDDVVIENVLEEQNEDEN